MRALALAVFLVVAGSIRADPIDDIVRRHRDALGGAEAVEALSAIRADGVIRSVGHQIKFEVVAQRPNRLRITLHAEGRTSIRGWDGTAAPWVFDLVRFRLGKPLSSEDARVFENDSEYDDPLIGGRARGFTLDYGGETRFADQPVFKVLVTQLTEPPSWLLVDETSYLIVARQAVRRALSGADTTTTTRYDDYRKVEGVWLAFHIAEFTDGQLTRETIISDISQLDHPTLAMFEPPVSSTSSPPPAAK